MSALSPFREDVELASAGETVPSDFEDEWEEGESWDPAPTEASPFAEAEVSFAPEEESVEEFDFGAAEAEAGHPILSVYAVPRPVIEALSGGLSSLAVGLAAGAGFRDVNQLTNIVFYFRHPDLIGQKISPEQRDLAAEWVSIRDQIVKPALQAPPAAQPAQSTAGTTAPADLSSSRLEWPEGTTEEQAFMRAVYDHHAAHARDAGAGFVRDLPGDALDPIEGRQARKDAAAAMKALLAEARAGLVAERLSGKIHIGLVSAYRPATRQFEIWQGRTFDGKRSGGGFPHYYREAIDKGVIRKGDFSPKAAAQMANYLGKFIASPGYSNHQDGLAFDLGTQQVGKSLGKIGWKSWFRKWLVKNAARHHFRPLDSEAWHWTYQPSTTSEVWSAEIAAPAGVRAGKLEVDRVPLLKSHRGKTPDLILRWNDMPSVPEQIDVVVHLHGFWHPGLELRRDIEPVSGLDLTPIKGASGQGRTRPTLTVLPRAHYTGVKQTHGSYYAYTFPALIKKDGLTELLRFSLERFAAEVQGAAPRVGRLILTAHSGGGKALLAILKYHDPHQVHVFDALYWPPDALVEWARRHIRQDSTALDPNQRGGLRVFYQGRYKGGTRPFSLKLRNEIATELTPELRNWYRIEASKYDHFQIPRRYGWRVLADTAADVPDAYIEQTQARHEVSELDFEDAAFEEEAEHEDLFGEDEFAEVVDDDELESDEDESYLREPELWAEEDEDEELEAPGVGEELEFSIGEEFAGDGAAGELDFEEETMLEAIGRGLWDSAVRIAIGTGITDATQLTNTIFYLKHPDLRGQKIGPDQHDLARDWVEIRDRWVKPALASHPATRTQPQPAGTPSTTAVRIKRVKSGHAAYGGGRLDASLRRLVQNGMLDISERDIDTLQRIADVESSGLTNALNSWDNAVMSIAFKQWTLRWGELQDLIDRAPEAFARHGIRLAPVGTNYVFTSKGKKWTQRAIDGVPDKDTLRNEDWGRRFFLAGLEPEAVGAAARKALEDIGKLEQNVRKRYGWSPHLESARGRALLAELDNNRPAYVKQAVTNALARAKERPGIGEDAFLEIFVAEVIAAYQAREHDADKGRRLTSKIMRQ